MFSRFEALDGYGSEEQHKLENSTVAVIGLGATGSVIAENLARHGVNLILVDRDYLEINDLYSSNIYSKDDCEKSLPKAVATEEYLSEFTDVESRVVSLDSSNTGILEDVDLIMDGTDNLDTRLLISEVSEKNDTPWIYTAALAESGYSMFFDEKCFNCLFDSVKPGKIGTCQSDGIMREISGISANLSSLKAIRYLTGKDLDEKLTTVPEGENLDVNCTGCNLCENGDFDRLNQERRATKICGEGKFQIEGDISDDAFRRVRESGELVADNDYLTRISIDEDSFTVFRSGRVIVEARDRNHAEARYSEILGH